MLRFLILSLMMAPMATVPTLITFSSRHHDRMYMRLANLGLLVALRFVPLLLDGIGLVALFAWSIRSRGEPRA